VNAPLLLVAVFPDINALRTALERLRDRKMKGFQVYSPASLLGLEHLLPTRGSAVRFLVILGAVIGATVGFWMSIGSALIYHMIVGGKIPASILPYCVLGFEFTVLFGGLTALIGVFALADLRPGRPSVGYDPRFGEDRFGIRLECTPEQAPALTALLREAGAEEVHEQPAS
jgi:hypothetical protein